MRVLIYMALGVHALLAAGCTSKEEPARQAVTSVETALNELRPGAEKYAPEQLRTAESDLAALQKHLADEKYTTVIAGTSKLNQELASLKEAVVSRQTQEAAAAREWEELSVEVPKMVAAIQNRVNNLAGSRLPKEVNKESFEAAKSTLASMKSTWAEATAAFDAGRAQEATDKARIVQAQAKEVSEQLGMNPV